MAGTHLDSVPEGPGINDNGTGSAAVLDEVQPLDACHSSTGGASPKRLARDQVLERTSHIVR